VNGSVLRKGVILRNGEEESRASNPYIPSTILGTFSLFSGYIITAEQEVKLEKKSTRKVVESKDYVFGSLCSCGSCATIKQHISTSVVPRLIYMDPKHVLVFHRAHSFIIDVQPSFPTTAVFVPVEHVDRTVPAACGLTVVVKHPMQLVVHRLRGFPGNGCDDF